MRAGRGQGMESETTGNTDRGSGCFRRMKLAANAKPLQNCFVTLGVRIAQVRQKPSTLRNQGEESLAGTMVLFMRLEMLREQRNPLTQEGNLYFWRPGVGFVALIVSKNLPLR